MRSFSGSYIRKNAKRGRIQEMSYYEQEDERAPKMISVVDPYVYETLQKIIGKRLVIETVRGNVTGNLKDVKPDHVVMKEKDSTFFVRIQQIVWIMPD
jgi:hypothetical protein